jgi:hypothetical protein
MSEQKPMSFMQELDKWTEATIIRPLHHAIVEGDDDDCTAASEAVKKAIREKTLESYHNGQKANVAAPATLPVRPATAAVRPVPRREWRPMKA